MANEGAIVMRITSDSSEVRADMASLMTSVKGSTQSLIHDIDGVTTTHNNLLRSDHRVAASLRGLTSEAVKSGDAFGVVGKAMESLAMATNVSLPALIGLEVIGTLISKMSEAHKEAVKLNKELDEAGKPRDPKSTVPIEEDIRKRFELAEKTRKEIEERVQAGKVPSFAGTMIGSGEESGSYVDRRNPRNVDRGRETFGSGVTDIHGDHSWSDKMARGKSDDQILKDKADAAEAMAKVIQIQAKAAKDLDELSDKVAPQKIDKLSFSLEDIAKYGRDKAPGDDSQPGMGKLAKRALREERNARQEMMNEHYPEAFQHQAKADELKNHIVALKDNEKDHLNAIQRAQIFRDIDRHVTEISFRGK